MDINKIFIGISATVTIAFTFYCYNKLKPKWNECTTYYSPSGSEHDYSILKDFLLRILLVGGSIFLFLHSVYFGIFDEWLLPYQRYAKSIIIFIGAFSYLIYIAQNSLNAVNSIINKKVEISGLQKRNIEEKK